MNWSITGWFAWMPRMKNYRTMLMHISTKCTCVASYLTFTIIKCCMRKKWDSVAVQLWRKARCFALWEPSYNRRKCRRNNTTVLPSRRIPVFSCSQNSCIKRYNKNGLVGVKFLFLSAKLLPSDWLSRVVRNLWVLFHLGLICSSRDKTILLEPVLVEAFSVKNKHTGLHKMRFSALTGAPFLPPWHHSLPAAWDSVIPSLWKAGPIAIYGLDLLTSFIIYFLV